jgi:hypothetical protein
MGRSHVSKRHREKPLRRHRATCERLVAETCALLEEDPEAHDWLADEVFRLADPWFMPGPDAPIPAHRHDLARKWIFVRMVGLASTAYDRARLAWDYAPTRPEDPGSGSRVHWGDPDYEEFLAAARALRRRRGLTGMEPTF